MLLLSWAGAWMIIISWLKYKEIELAGTPWGGYIGFFGHLTAMDSDNSDVIQSPKKMECCNKTCRDI